MFYDSIDIKFQEIQIIFTVSQSVATGLWWGRTTTKDNGGKFKSDDNVLLYKFGD